MTHNSTALFSTPLMLLGILPLGKKPCIKVPTCNSFSNNRILIAKNLEGFIELFSFLPFLLPSFCFLSYSTYGIFPENCQQQCMLSTFSNKELSCGFSPQIPLTSIPHCHVRKVPFYDVFSLVTNSSGVYRCTPTLVSKMRDNP